MNVGQLINLPPVKGIRSNLYLRCFKLLMPQCHGRAAKHGDSCRPIILSCTLLSNRFLPKTMLFSLSCLCLSILHPRLRFVFLGILADGIVSLFPGGKDFSGISSTETLVDCGRHEMPAKLPGGEVRIRIAVKLRKPI
jgi:hypothetical protein